MEISFRAEKTCAHHGGFILKIFITFIIIFLPFMRRARWWQTKIIVIGADEDEATSLVADDF
jgi:hypothetical protein